MHPAISVIIFTVVSGLGLGLLMLSASLSISGLINHSTAFSTTLTGLVLTILGLLSSTLHLANPVNAWRAFSRFKTSWLSREAVFAILLLAVVVLYLLALPSSTAQTQSSIALLLAGLTLVLALATVIATAMIYACLRTIPQWNNALVPANYLLLALSSGCLLLILISLFQAMMPSWLPLLAGLFLFLSAVLKGLYYLWVGMPQGLSINSATGFTRAQVTLLDIGHSADTFNTEEFGYRADNTLLYLLRWAVFVLAFGLPLICCAWLYQNANQWLAIFALLSCLCGILIERWLFFAQARHSVSLYHGEQNC